MPSSFRSRSVLEYVERRVPSAGVCSQARGPCFQRIPYIPSGACWFNSLSGVPVTRMISSVDRDTLVR